MRTTTLCFARAGRDHAGLGRASPRLPAVTRYRGSAAGLGCSAVLPWWHSRSMASRCPELRCPDLWRLAGGTPTTLQPSRARESRSTSTLTAIQPAACLPALILASPSPLPWRGQYVPPPCARSLKWRWCPAARGEGMAFRALAAFADRTRSLSVAQLPGACAAWSGARGAIVAGAVGHFAAVGSLLLFNLFSMCTAMRATGVWVPLPQSIASPWQSASQLHAGDLHRPTSEIGQRCRRRPVSALMFHCAGVRRLINPGTHRMGSTRPPPTALMTRATRTEPAWAGTRRRSTRRPSRIMYGPGGKNP